MVSIRYEDEHALLRDEARRWLAEHHSMEYVRRVAEDGRDDGTTWAALQQLGWHSLTIPTTFGGAGLGMTHAAVLLEESGRHLLTAPLLPVLLGALVIERCGSDEQRARFLGEVVRKGRIATLAHVEPSGGWTVEATSVRRENGRLRGEKWYVWNAQSADLFLVPFREGSNGATQVAVVPATADGVEIQAETGLDPTRRSGRLVLRDVSVADADVLTASVNQLHDLLPRACVWLAAEMAGGADALLSMTTAYAATRVQFGRPIGSFQAVKHPLVNVLIGVEQLRSLVYAAASAIDAEAPEAELLARMAKAHASDVYVFAASRAVQFHGGFGFTYDCDAHFYLKRAHASRPAFGDGAYHRQWIAQHLVGA